MNSDLLREVRMAQRLYYLSTKYENRLPKTVVEFSKDVCNKYTKKAKEMELSLNSSELIDYILK